MTLRFVLAAGRMAYRLNPQGGRTTFAYDAAGQRTRKDEPDGTRTSFTYDATGRLQSVADYEADDTVISIFEYQCDNVGNRTSVLEASGDRTTLRHLANERRTCIIRLFAVRCGSTASVAAKAPYDATHQLTGEQRSGDNAHGQPFGYDAIGNRLVKVEHGARTTYTYDTANQSQTSEAADGITTYAFRERGSQVRRSDCH